MGAMILIIKGLAQNICLFLALSYLYGFSSAYLKSKSTSFQGVVNGVIFALIAGLGMLMNIELMPGRIIDGRIIIIGIAGAYGGMVPGITAALLVSIFRVFIGGSGVVLGCVGIWGGALIGILFWSRRKKEKISFNFPLLLTLGLLLTLQAQLWVPLLLPPDVAWDLIKRVSIPAIMLYPPGTLLLGYLLNRCEYDSLLNFQLKQSEKKYRTIFENMAQGVFYQRADGVLLDCNPAVLEMFGLTRDQFLGQTSMHPEWRIIQEDGSDLTGEQHPSMLALKTGKPVRNAIAGVFNPRKQDFVWLSINALPLFETGQRNPSQVFVTLHDITDRKKTGMSLKNERDLIERMMSTSPAGIVRVNSDGMIVYANKRAEEILDIQQSDLSGRAYNDPVWKITDFEGGPFPENNLPFAMVKQHNQPVFNVRHAIQWPEGGRVLLSINAAPLLDASGSFDGMVATIEDITERYQTEQKYQMLFNEMIDAFALHEIICDNMQRPVDYRFLAVNPAFERLTGLNGASLIGKTVLEVLPNTESYWIETYGAVALTGKPTFFENYSREIDRYYQVTAFRPAPNQFACIFVDITERKIAEKALWESTERFQKVFQNQPDAIFVLNTEHPARILESNRAAAKIFGYNAEELIGATLEQLFVNKSRQEEFLSKLFAAVKQDGSLLNMEFSMKRKDGTMFPSEHTVLELKNDADERTGWVHVVRDLTDRKELEVRLQQAQRMEAIGTLAGGIAHDFNNILSPIIGMAELLMDDVPSGSPQHEDLNEIFNAGRRGSEMVKQILAFSRQSEHQQVPVRLPQILGEVLKLIRSTIPVDIKISSDIHPKCGLIMADPTQMHQVAMNLITNAFHAVESSDGEIKVDLKEVGLDGGGLNGTSLPAGKYAMLTVSDTGHGIDPDLINKIFNPYFTTKEQGKGTGLGLAVVYGIIRNHAGDITVESTLSKGTTFTVYLPVMERSFVPEERFKDEALPTGNERILLVDDEEQVVKLERRMLERLGYRIAQRTSSVEALEAFKAAPDAFDLVLTDMTMPNMTGDRLARQLMAIRPDLPVIICTGFSERMTPEKADVMGIKGFLMKPLIKSDLAQLIRRVLDQAKRVRNGWD